MTVKSNDDSASVGKDKANHAGRHARNGSGELADWLELFYAFAEPAYSYN